MNYNAPPPIRRSGALLNALLQQSQQQGQQQAQQGQQQQSGSNNLSNILRATQKASELWGPSSGSLLAGANLGGAGSALATSPLFGGAGAGGAASYGGGVASAGLPGIFPGATVGSGASGATGALGGSTAGSGAAGGLAAAAPAAGFAAIAAIVAQGFLKGIFGKPDGPPNNSRDRANQNAQEATWSMLLQNGETPYTYQKSDDYGGGRLISNIDPSNKSLKYDWLTPELYDTWNSAQAANNGQSVSMSPDLKQWNYNSDSGPLAAYLKSQYGTPQGGYTDDQYGAAEDYFRILNYNLNRDINLGYGGG